MITQLKSFGRAVAPRPVTMAWGRWYGAQKIRRARAAFDSTNPACAATYIGVDEAKREPAAAVAASGLRYEPTLIVGRNGHEVGRIVEKSPHGVEVDLLALLEGKASGLLTASPNLAAAGSAPPSAPPIPCPPASWTSHNNSALLVSRRPV